VDLSTRTLGEFFARLVATEWHPPGFFLLAYLWTRAFGTGELALKSLPYLFSVATIPLVYLLGRRAASEAAGLVAAAAFALAPAAIAYSDMYLYPVMGFFATLLACVVTQIRRDRANPKLLAAALIVAVAVVYLHYTALLYLPLLLAWSLTAPSGRRQGFALAIVLGAALVCFIPWLPVFLQQRHVGVPYLSPMTPGQKATQGLWMLINLMPVAPLRAQFVAFVLLCSQTIVLARERALRSDAASLGAIFFIIVAVIEAQGLPIIRYAVCFYALFCVFIGWVAVAAAQNVAWALKMTQTARTVAAAAIGAAVLAANASVAVANASMAQSGIRAFLSAHPPDPATLYVIAPDYMAATFAFYARNSDVRFIGFPKQRQPEVYEVARDADNWNDPKAVSNALATVRALSQRYAYLDVVADASARDRGRVPYGKTWTLLARLDRRYRLLDRTLYPGKIELVYVYRFALKPETTL
jgi:uncharacterized membrane protein